MLNSIKSFFTKTKKKKTKEDYIKEVICSILAVVILGILAAFFRPVSAQADYGLEWTESPNKYKDSEGNEFPTYDITESSSSGSLADKLIESNVIEPVLTGVLEKAIPIVNFAIEWVVKLISSSFSPTLNPLVAIETGTPVEVEAGLSSITGTGLLESAKGGHITLGDSVIMGSIWKFSMFFGIATATLIALFNLLLCVFGRAQDIKDSPAGIAFKYGIALLLIFLSRAFMTSFINLYGDIWTQFIWNENLLEAVDGSSMGSCFIPLRVMETEGLIQLFGSTYFRIGAATGTSILISSATSGLGLLLILVLIIIAFVMAWKLISEFLKLFLEIVERYFVFFILIAFFPCMAATITTNNSKKIFYAYVKMVYTQGFLLIVNTVFMSLFVYVLLHGGWVAGLLNYLAALAFLRVCQRIDAYMAQMGFNVVQTGAGLAGAMGGAGLGLMTAMRGMQMLNRGRQNIGNGIKDLGLRSNNSGLAKAGAVIGATGRDVIGGGLSNEGLSQSIMSGQAGFISDAQGGSGAGRIGTVSEPLGDWGTAQNSMKDFGMPEELAASTCRDLKEAGYSPSDIGGIQQNNDTADSFDIMDSNGTSIATADKSGVETIDKSDYDAANKDLDMMSGNEEERGFASSRSVPQGLSESLDEYASRSGVTQDMYRSSFIEEAAAYGASSSNEGSGASAQNINSNNNNQSTSSENKSTSLNASKELGRSNNVEVVPGKAGYYNQNLKVVDNNGRSQDAKIEVRPYVGNSHLAKDPNWRMTTQVVNGRKKKAFISKPSINKPSQKNISSSPTNGKRK